MLDIYFLPQPEVKIFGFAEFIVALALLIIIYTVTDVRYRFRIAISRFPLFKITYFLIALIGIGTLLTDLWFAENWPISDKFNDQHIWQTGFGAIFLLTILWWLYLAFINPPKFSKKNYKKFSSILKQIILKGADHELSVIADELATSASSLVKLSKEFKYSSLGSNGKKRKYNVSDYAYEIIMLIGNRKLCRHVVSSCPGTAIIFFKTIADTKKYKIPIRQFSINISTEALINKDSIIFHEDEGYNSGLLGYVKPFTQAIYGNYTLVEALAKNKGSPLDIHYEYRDAWEAKQLKAYCRAVLITLSDYIQSGSWPEQSVALNQAISNIQDASCRDIYKLNDTSIDSHSTDTCKRLSVAIDFIKKAIKIFDAQKNVPVTKLRIRKNDQENFYDGIADLIFQIMSSVADIKSSPDKCWSLQYVSVWYPIFCTDYNGKAWKIIRHKLRRILYDEICRLKQTPNYRSSKILGICLNIMGLTLEDKKLSHGTNYYSLHKVVLEWVKNNYLWLNSTDKEMAQSCLIGNISFDEENLRLVITGTKIFSREATKKFLSLSPPQ